MEKKNIARVTSEPKNPIYRHDLGKTSYNDLLFTRGEFLWLVGPKKFSPTNYFNILYVQIMIYDQNNFARVAAEPIKPI